MVSFSLTFALLSALAAVTAAPAQQLQTSNNVTIEDTTAHTLQARGYKWWPKSFYRGQAISNAFDYETLDDPNGSRVNYINGEEAKAKGLAYVEGNNERWIIRPDYKNKVAAGARGRDSVRMISKESWKEFLMVADIQHAPVGPGVWPALWTLGEGVWPKGGEIDILEATDRKGVNWYTIHTSRENQCVAAQVPAGEVTAEQSGRQCQGEAGCRFMSKAASSWGDEFNRIGGGWIVTRITDQGIAFWWFPRDDPNVPETIRAGGSIDEDILGKKEADFKFEDKPGCTMNEQFSPQKIILNVALCGRHASGDFMKNGVSEDQAAADCAAHVDAHPEDYAEAYWTINELRMYQRY